MNVWFKLESTSLRDRGTQRLELSLIADAGGVPAELDRRADFRDDVRGLVHKARDYGLVHPVKEFKAWTFE